MITYQVVNNMLTIRLMCPITHHLTVYYHYITEDNIIQELSHSLNPLEAVKDRYPLLITNNIIGKPVNEVVGIINTYNLLEVWTMYQIIELIITAALILVFSFVVFSLWDLKL